MPDAVAEDSIARRADDATPAFVCSWSDGGLDAAWVHLGGELDVATVPQLEHTLGESRLQAQLVVLDNQKVERTKHLEVVNPGTLDGLGLRPSLRTPLRKAPTHRPD